MRNFIISLICLLSLVTLWCAFSLYSSRTTEQIQTQTEKLISRSINQGNWDSAEKDYNDLISLWESYKKSALIFLDSKDINDIDCTLEKAYLYMKAKDISNSSGEFSYLKEKFMILHQNDAVTFSNVF